MICNPYPSLHPSSSQPFYNCINCYITCWVTCWDHLCFKQRFLVRSHSGPTIFFILASMLCAGSFFIFDRSQSSIRGDSQEFPCLVLSVGIFGSDSGANRAGSSPPTLLPEQAQDSVPGNLPDFSD